MTLQAIETTYKGYRMRSRLEARWAVAFEVLGLEWYYEREGYVMNDGSFYLPDFEIINPHGKRFFVEVKGDEKEMVRDWRKWVHRLDGRRNGLPSFEDSTPGRTTGLVLLGNIPEPGPVWCHPTISHWKGLNRTWSVLSKEFGVMTSLKWGHEQGVETDAKMWDAAPRYHRPPNPSDPIFSDITKAYSAARSARFEHGEGR